MPVVGGGAGWREIAGTRAPGVSQRGGLLRGGSGSDAPAAHPRRWAPVRGDAGASMRARWTHPAAAPPLTEESRGGKWVENGGSARGGGVAVDGRWCRGPPSLRRGRARPGRLRPRTGTGAGPTARWGLNTHIGVDDLGAPHHDSGAPRRGQEPGPTTWPQRLVGRVAVSSGRGPPSGAAGRR